MRAHVFVLAVLFSFGSPIGLSAQQPPKPLPELQALEHLIGTWDETMTNKATEWIPEAGTSTSITKKSWYLGGKFIRMEGSWQPAKTEFLALLSYDTDNKVYREWYFDSGGAMPRGISKGTWDAKTRTLSTTATDEGGNKWVSKTTITDKDHLEWHVVVTNPAGKVVMDVSGKNTRRKD